MLVLTRKLGQTIVLNNEIEIIIVQVKGKQVRIGVKAPKDTSIHRKEIQEEINNGIKQDEK